MDYFLEFAQQTVRFQIEMRSIASDELCHSLNNSATVTDGVVRALNGNKIGFIRNPKRNVACIAERNRN